MGGQIEMGLNKFDLKIWGKFLGQDPSRLFTNRAANHSEGARPLIVVKNKDGNKVNI